MDTFNNNSKWKNKYPDIFVDTNSLIIDLNRIGGILNMINFLEKQNDYQSIQNSGLIDFKKDLHYILDSNYLKKLRKEKLLNIQNNDTDSKRY